MTNNALNGRIHNGADNVPCTVRSTDETCDFIEELVGVNPGYVFTR